MLEVVVVVVLAGATVELFAVGFFFLVVGSVVGVLLRCVGALVVGVAVLGVSGVLGELVGDAFLLMMLSLSCCRGVLFVLLVAGFELALSLLGPLIANA